MPITALPFTGGFYEAESLTLSAQQCQNAYPAVAEQGGLSQEVLYDTPGLAQVASTGQLATDANRGSHTFNARPYFVNGTELHRMNADHTTTLIGTIEGTQRVWMADNGDQLCVLVPGGKGYIFTEATGVLAEITDPDFRANGEPQAVCFIDGYFCFTTDEKRFIVSELNDGLNYNALDFGSAESSPDGTVAPFVWKNQLFIAGTRTIEGFSNVGGTGFPFQRSGLFLDQGLRAPFSLVDTPDTVMFIGAGDNEGPSIYVTEGNSVKPVSTQAIDALLDRLSLDDLNSMFGWHYTQAGHRFIGFALPDTCIVYDLTTGKWHERISRVTGLDESVQDKRCRINSITSAYGVLYVGDSEDGRIGRLDLTTHTEYSENIFRVFSTQPFQNNMLPFTVPMIELTVDAGVGNDNAPDPQIRLDISRDGGRTWGVERRRAMGKQGEWYRRAIWRRNGQTQRFDVYRFSFAEPCKFTAVQLTADIRGTAG